MPLVKQGKFKEYYNSCKKIKNNFERCHNIYFDKNGNYNCDMEIFSEFFYDIDGVYVEAMALKTKLENLIETSEQKTEKSIEKCEKCIGHMEHIIDECIWDFRKVYTLLNGNFSAVEAETFKNYKIYREI